MLFNSWVFLVFALVVFPIYFKLERKGQNIWLLLASYLFYGYWDWRFLGLIAGSTLIDYFLAIKIEESEETKRRHYLFLSCLFNLGALGFFKYWGFFVDSATLALGGLLGDPNRLRLDIVLPVGISFYTFQTMSYTIDVYRGKLKASRDFLDYSLYVAFFPQLVAGPIERASHLLPQIQKSRQINSDQILSGAWLIIWGLFKKVIIADNLAIVVDRTFNQTGNASGLECLLAVYAFAYQIYCDFSGYSDMARGLAKLLGIDIMRNFNIPYFSKNPQDFWNRWHISLSTWLRDYLYIPLGGNRGGEWFTYRNLLLTMILGGLWHGAAFTFILWGIYQGLLLVLHRLFVQGKEIFKEDSFFGDLFVRIGWFHLVCGGWLIFRATSVNQIGEFLKKIFSDWSVTPTLFPLLTSTFLFVGLLWLFELYVKNEDDPRGSWKWKEGVGAITVSVLLLLLIIFAPPNMQSFIYFQF